jgi:hypothetical protein
MQITAMGNAEYNEVYWEAREALYRRGRKVGGPVNGHDRVRRCTVNGVLLNDRELFEDAWGKVLAEEIIQEHAESESYPDGCRECDRLLRDYFVATKHYLKIFTDQQLAVIGQDSDALTEISASLRKNAETRRITRHRVCDHTATHSFRTRC